MGNTSSWPGHRRPGRLRALGGTSLAHLEVKPFRRTRVLLCVAQAARRQSLAPGAGAAPAGKRKAAAPAVPPGRAARPRLH